MRGDVHVNSQNLLFELSNVQKEVGQLLDEEIILFVKDLPDDISEIITYLFRQGGKRIRPAFFLYIASQIDKTINLGPYTLAIELIHNMSLYHDDFIDSAKERRGSPTVHQYYDEATAIIGGDILHSQIHRYILQASENGRIELLPSVKFLKELLDVEVTIGSNVLTEMKMANSKKIPSFNRALEISSGKTAPLFGFSAKAAAIVCNHPDIAEKLYEFGYEFGKSFQLLDDLLDFFESDKDVGGDLREGKKTPIIALVNQTKPDLVSNLLSRDDISRSEINHFVKQASIEFRKIITIIENHLNTSKNLIRSLEIDKEVSILFDLVAIKIKDLKNKI